MSASIRAAYLAATTDSERTAALFACEQHPSDALVDFLLAIAADVGAYDLTRIEAMKAAGLCAAALPERVRDIADALAVLGTRDPDSDIRNWALQALAFVPPLPHIPEAIASALAPDEDLDVRYAARAVLGKQPEHPVAARLLAVTVERARSRRGRSRGSK